MNANLVVLPGDGIGPEVTQAAVQVLEAIASKYDHHFIFSEHLLGGCAIDAQGTALPDETLAACLEADAVLLGAVGGPKWDDPTAAVRPEQGLLGLRKSLGLFANLRPVKAHDELLDSSPLKPERLRDVDLIVVRELTGGIYFGEPRERRIINDDVQAIDTMVYSKSEIQRVTRLAFETARNRRRKVTSVDKANVLECSRLWRQTVIEVANEYPDIQLEHLLVDAATMHLINRPGSFDVIVTGNLFGDILTDEASVITGSMGNLPSASLGSAINSLGQPRGLYEPIHGSAPDIAGKGIANPIGTVLSSALLVRNSLGLKKEANAIENAVYQALAFGNRTADLAGSGRKTLGTREMTAAIADYIV